MRTFWFSVLLLWCFTSSAFACTDDELREQLTQNITNYIVDCGYSPGEFPEAVVEIAYGEFGLDPWVFTFIARYESHWNPDVIGAAGERGWVQIHPGHDRCAGHGVKTNGLSWDNPRDLLWVACKMVQEDLEQGETLYQAFSPWTTRKRAWNSYADYHGKPPQKDGKHPLSP